MNAEEKKSLSERVARWAESFKSLRAAGNAMGVSVATVSKLVNGKTDGMSLALLQQVERAIGQGATTDRAEWNIVETTAFKEISYALADAQEWRNVTWVVSEAGSGKTTTARVYARDHREVFYVLCSEDMKRGDFVREIARVVGVKAQGMVLRELWEEILTSVSCMDAPLLVFDEADKLIDSVFHYFITLYNRLEDSCGVVFLSTDYIKRRVRQGLRYQKVGYKEFYSRMGRKFYETEETSAQDVLSVCAGNGVTGSAAEEIVTECLDYDFDLRRVRKSVHRRKRMQS